jgi:hypothetical protein
MEGAREKRNGSSINEIDGERLGGWKAKGEEERSLLCCLGGVDFTQEHFSKIFSQTWTNIFLVIYHMLRILSPQRRKFSLGVYYARQYLLNDLKIHGRDAFQGLLVHPSCESKVFGR